jgi:hypothetical protein
MKTTKCSIVSTATPSTPLRPEVNPSTSTAAADSPPYTGPKVSLTTKQNSLKTTISNTVLQRRPVCRPGVEFVLEDNREVDRTKAVLGVPERHKIRFSLTSTQGEKIRFPYRGDIAEDWNDPNFIAYVNKWRDQIFRRRGLTEQTPAGGVKRRSKYSDREKEYLRFKIKRHMRQTKRWLTGDDWKVITEEHNARFKGKKTKVGERLASGKQATIEFEIVERSTSSLKLQFKRSELKEIETEILAEDEIVLATPLALATGSTPRPTKQEAKEEKDDEKEEDSEDSESDDGEGVPMGVEEDTDDEFEDQRPAGNTTGGILINAC